MGPASEEVAVVELEVLEVVVEAVGKGELDCAGEVVE